MSESYRDLELENSRGKELFRLDSQLLQDYPEIAILSKEAPEISNISGIYMDGNIIDSYIEGVKTGKSTGDIRYHLKMLEREFDELSALNKPEYSNFIRKEREKFNARKLRAQMAIGKKKRDETTNGKYL